jgi:hypothetical protein
MSHPMIRRGLAGLALLALLAAAPAQAAGLGRPAGGQDLLTLVWSWMARLWGGQVSPVQASGKGAAVKEKQATGDSSGGDTTQTDDTTQTGDKGMGIDPDG